MEDRKKAILSQIIEEYLENAEPVGSKMIVDKYDWEVSPATMRNEMASLEEEGYMTHLHTSAGRQPTEKGYRWYVESLEPEVCALPSRISEWLSRSFQKREGADSENVKQLAKTVAEIAETAVVVGFGKNDTYYTGLSYLFSRPEFEDVSLVKSFSEMLDHLDEAMEELFEDVQDQDVRIGSENPFGSECSLISGKLSRLGYLFGILGPMRMDYKKNIGLVKWVRENA